MACSSGGTGWPFGNNRNPNLDDGYASQFGNKFGEPCRNPNLDDGYGTGWQFGNKFGEPCRNPNLDSSYGTGWQIGNKFGEPCHMPMGDNQTLPDGDTVMGEPGLPPFSPPRPVTRARAREVDEWYKNLPTYGDLYPPEYFRKTYPEPEPYCGPTVGEISERRKNQVSNPFLGFIPDKPSESTILDPNMCPDTGRYFNVLNEQRKPDRPPPRRSPRMSKYFGRYGFAGGPPTPLPLEFKHLLRHKSSAGTMSPETRANEITKLLEKLGSSNTPFVGAPTGQSVPKPQGPTAKDQLVNKYVAAGLSKEAVPFAVRKYGDNAAKVEEFAEKFTRLREMVPDPPELVAEALIVQGMDMDKALAVLPLIRNIGCTRSSSLMF